jgi:GNAT superfamily N-acetyltransferase
VGTATLLAQDVDTEQWPELSPWLAAVYVVPEYRHRGIGAALVPALARAAPRSVR